MSCIYGTPVHTQLPKLEVNCLIPEECMLGKKTTTHRILHKEKGSSGLLLDGYITLSTGWGWKTAQETTETNFKIVLRAVT